MKRSIVTLVCLVISIYSYSQTNEANLEKYWKFRNNFRKNFVKIGAGQAESIPLNAYRPNYACADFVNNQSVQHGSLKWGDAPSRIGFYLMMLSTEYRLLKDQGKDVTSVLNEIYYALETFNRLDRSAEPYLTQLALPPTLDGYHIRDDVYEDFYLNFSEYNGEDFQCVDADFFLRNNVFNIDDGSNLVYKTYLDNNFPSKDQLSGILPGLAFVAKFVDNEFVKPTANDIGFNLVDETKAITDRYISYLKNHEWFYRDHSNNDSLVKNGGGDLAIESYPISVIANKINGQNYSNPFYREVKDYRPNIPSIFNYEILISPAQLEEYWTTELPFSAAQNLATWDCYNSSVVVAQIFDGKICPGYENAADLFNEHNINTILVWVVLANLWDKSIVHSWADGSGFIYHDLIYSLYNDTSPYGTQNYYRQLLDGMQCEGPYAKRLGPGQIDPAPGGWAAENRWIKPTYAYTGSPQEDQLGEYSALDYMLFHNMYYLAFKDQLPEFEQKYACECNDEIIAASTTTLSSQVLVTKKFNDYYEKGIDEMHFLSHDLTIDNSGEIVLETDLTICNNSTVSMVNNGLIVTSNAVNNRKGDLFVNGGSTIVIDDNGLLNVKTGTVAYLNENSILQIKANGKLKVEDNGTLIIESGAKLIFDENAIIELSGNNAVLEIQGNVEIKDNAVFTFTGSGFVRWNTPYQPNSNVIAGLNSKIRFQGSSRSDKVLEISNERGSGDCWMPDNLSSFQILSGKTEFMDNGRLVLPCPFSITASDFVTSTTPFTNSRGVWVAGQQGMILNGCNFYNTDVDGALIYGGNPLKLFSCKFNDFSQIKIDGAGYQLANCNFNNCPAGVESSDIYLPSFYRNGTMTNCPEGIANSTASTTVSIERIQMNSTIPGDFGVYQHQGLLNLRCSGIRDNSNGVYLYQGANLNASIIGNTGGYSTISGSQANILLQSSGLLNLDNGYNVLLPGTGNQSKIITGNLNLPCNGNPFNIPANENKWLSNNSIDPNIFPGSPQTGNFPNAYNNPTAIGTCDVLFTDANRGATASCGQFDVNSPGGISQASVFRSCASCPMVNGTYFNNVRMNDAILIAMEKMELIDTTLSDPNRNDFTAILMFNEIMTQPGLDLNDPDVAFLARFSYQMVKTTLQNCLNTGRLTKANNNPNLHNCSNHYLNVLNVLRKPVTADNFKEQFSLEMDNALLYYWVGRYADAIQLLGHIDNCYLTDEEYRLLNYWKESITLKNRFITNQISLDEYVTLREELPRIKPPRAINIDPSANVNSTATIGQGATIGSGTTVGENVVIGENSTIGNNVSIDKDVTIGNDVIISDNTSIGKESKIGSMTSIGINTSIDRESQIGSNVQIANNVSIAKQTKIGDWVRIDDDVVVDKESEIADGSYIGRNTKIDKETKIGSNSIIRRNVVIEKENSIGDKTIIDNDTKIKKESKIGQSVLIAEGLTIGNGAKLCDGSNVSLDVANNTTIGSCSNPTAPLSPFGVAHDEIFAVAQAHIYGKMENGFTLTPTADHYFVGQNITFSANNFASEVLWDFGNCSHATSPIASYSFTNPGVYVITLKVNPPQGCANNVSKTYIGSISVHPKPTIEVEPQIPSCPSSEPVKFNIEFDATANIPGCMSKYGTYCTYSQLRSELCRLSLSSNYGDGNQETNQYFFNQLGVPIFKSHIYEEAINYNYDFEGNYEVMQLTTENWVPINYSVSSQGSISLTNGINAGFEIDNLICVNDAVTISNTSKFNQPLNYYWLLSDGQTSIERNPIFDLSAVGEYTLSLVVSDTLGICTDTLIKSFEVGNCQHSMMNNNDGNTFSNLYSNKKEIEINIYPNPASNLVNIKLSSVMDEFLVEVYDITGKRISSNLFGKTDNILIHTHEYVSGIYSIRLVTKENSYSKLFVIDK